MITDDGAAAWYARGSGARGRHGVLLLHGFTGSPWAMRPWAEHLHAAGWTVSLPLLPGHGTSWQEMNTTTWRDWYAGAERALDELLDGCDTVSVAGLSMGGCLALRMAQERDTDVAALVLVNPSVASSDKRLVALPIVSRLVSSLAGIGNDIKKPGQDELAYDRVPLRALASMREMWGSTVEGLAKVTAPLLLLRSETDHVVDPSSADLVLTRVSSREAHEVVLQHSYHVATLDHDAPLIFDRSTQFLHEHVRHHA